jgi:hypothetical protein
MFRASSVPIIRSYQLYTWFWILDASCWLFIRRLSRCTVTWKQSTSPLFTTGHHLLGVQYKMGLESNLFADFVNKANLEHKIFLSMFISFVYMFLATMCPSSGETTVFIRHFVLVILYGWLSGMQGGTLIQGCTVNKTLKLFADVKKYNTTQNSALHYRNNLSSQDTTAFPPKALATRTHGLTITNTKTFFYKKVKGTP